MLAKLQIFIALTITTTLVLLSDREAMSSVRGGANGLEDLAEATSEACRRLKSRWSQTGVVPKTIEILGSVRTVIDLSGEGVLPGTDTEHLLQNTFDAVEARESRILFLPPNQDKEPYVRSGQLTISSEDTVLCGYGAILKSVEASNLGLGINANRIGIYGLTMVAPKGAFADWVERWNKSEGIEPPTKFPLEDGREFGAWASHLLLLGAEDVVLRDVTMLGAKRGGVRMYGASNVLVEGACVYRPHSDGIHIVHGSQDVTVRNSQVIESGDDCISVVTYDRDKYPQTVSNVLIQNNSCEGSRTRGLSVIGGENVSIIGNEVHDTLAAGILLYPSPRHNTHPVRSIKIEENVLDGAGLRGDVCGNCGDIVANDPNHMVEEVSIGANRINVRPPGSDVRSFSTCVIGSD